MSPLRSFIGHVIYLVGIGTVNDHSRHTIADGAVGEIFARDLAIDWRGICPQVVFDDEDYAKLLHRREVKTLVGWTSRLSAIADPGKTCDVLALESRSQSDSRQHGNQISQHRDGGSDVAFVLVPEMGTGISSAGRRARLCHV